MMKKIIGAVLVAACGAVSTGAMAVPVTLTGSIADNTLLNSGTVSGVFDGSAVLPADYTINSLAFSFTFLDDSDPTTSSTKVNGTTATGYSYDGSLFKWVRDMTTSQTTTVTGQQESVALALAGVNVGSGATASTTSSTTTKTNAGYTYDGCVFFVCGYSNNITLTTTNSEIWTGGFTISGTVTDASILNQLLSNDQLSYSMNVAGDLYLVSSQLNLDVTATPKAPSGAVPEPSTLLLGLAGLGGLGLSRRRKNRA